MPVGHSIEPQEAVRAATAQPLVADSPAFAASPDARLLSPGFPSPTPRSVLALQRAIGNGAVAALLRRPTWMPTLVSAPPAEVRRAVDEYGGARGKANVKAGITAKIEQVLAGINRTTAQQIAAGYQAGLSTEAEVDEILDGLGGCFNDLSKAPAVLHAYKDRPNRVLRLVRQGVNAGRWGYEDKAKTPDSLDELMGKNAAELVWYGGEKEIKAAGGNPFSYLAMMDVKVYGAAWAVVHIHYANNQNRTGGNIYKIHMKPTHGSNNRADIDTQAAKDAAQAVVDARADADFPDHNNFNVAAVH